MYISKFCLNIINLNLLNIFFLNFYNFFNDINNNLKIKEKIKNKKKITI